MEMEGAFIDLCSVRTHSETSFLAARS